MRSATAVVMSDSELREVMVDVTPGKTGPGFPGHRSKVGVLGPDATAIGQEPGRVFMIQEFPAGRALEREPLNESLAGR
jgi:hypothetical protein